MKAVFTLTPAESRRLIAKAVVQMDSNPAPFKAGGSVGHQAHSNRDGIVNTRM